MTESPGFLRQLVRLGPHAGAHRAAIRCAVSVGAPMLVLLLTDRLDLLGAAAFGAFTAVYGRADPVPARTVRQSLTAVGLVLCVAAGLLAAHLPAQPWSGLAVLVIVATLATTAVTMAGSKPPGSLFFVFATGAFAAAPAMDAAATATTLLVTAASGAFSVLVGSVGGLRPGRDRRRSPLFSRTLRTAIAGDVVVDVTVAAALAAATATILDLDHAYWAVVAAVVVASVSLRGPWIVRGTQRVLGTTLGLLVAAPLLSAGLDAVGVVLVAVLLQFGAELLVARNYGLAMLFITPLALVLSSTMHPAPAASLLADRLAATALGVALAFTVLFARSRLTRRG